MTSPMDGKHAVGLSPEDRAGVYKAIFARRDIRSQFLPDEIPDDVLARILHAAHHAPSVGFMQPWDFILVRDREIRARVKAAFMRATAHAEALFAAQDRAKAKAYRNFKLEGILESPLNICVTCDRSRTGPVVIGRTSQRTMDLYSSVCAVQNLWLAARAEGLGVGWVSIVSASDLKAILNLPPHVEPVGYLCIGYVSEFPDQPELETAGWLPRLPLTNVIRIDGWPTKLNGEWAGLSTAIGLESGQKAVPGARAAIAGPATMARKPLHDAEASGIVGAPPADFLQQVRASIRPPCEAAYEAASNHLDRLTKPQGSLGRIEELARRVLAMRRGDASDLLHKCVVVMAGDHGVVEEGVSAFPQVVTQQMVLNFLQGGAGINVLARHAGAEVLVVDMGVAAELPEEPRLISRRIGPGTRNFTRGPAMTREEAMRALYAGYLLAGDLVAWGFDLVGTGDMGIGNTTPSAAITAVLTGRDVADVTGRGTGIDDAGLENKIAAIRKGIAVNAPDPSDAIDVLSKVGGFEIAGLAGLILGCGAHAIPIVIDGFISGAAALIAYSIEPQSVGYMIAAHASVEQGHAAALEFMGLKPLLNLDLRLGEGTGAALAFPLVEAGLRIHNEMATFASAGVSEKHG